ncbi:MAG TPA: RHS repeat-associated core domain-containing protein, partial [Pyrinomonadaceae bacterium]|nr:RHS repeat-associated core domain-containing protein [Pyrinomonadaceae bacterium]
DATGQQTYASATGLIQYYDGDRLRTRKTESGVDTYYLRSTVLGGQVVAELNASGAWTRGYVYLGGQMLALHGGAGGQVSWVHQDPVTKSQRVTNSSGSVVSTIDLDPWGGETGRSSNQAFQPQRYTSYTRDGNGGDDAMHRRYQVNWSRFAQPDPYDGSYSLGDPQSFNRYAYVRNDPVNLTDPSGLDWQGDLGDPPPLPGGPTASVDIPISFDDPFDDPFFRRNDWGGAFLPLPMVPFEPPIGPILPQDPVSSGLPDCIKKYLSKFFDRAMLDAIILEKGLPSFVPPDKGAFTFGDRVYYKESEYNAADGIQPGDIILMGHEATHVRQYRQNGRLRQAARYLANSVKMGAIGTAVAGMQFMDFFSYFANKFESEAFRMGEEIRKDLIVNGNPCP